MGTYYVIASLVIFVGAGLSADMLWNIADITMGTMALINIPVIVLLGRTAIRALKDYEKKVKNGEDPVFHAEDIGLLQDTDAWK